MILIDFSNAVLACIHSYDGPELKKGADQTETSSVIKHYFFNKVLSDVKKFKGKFGEVVFCVDGNNYWRKQKYPWYKGHRKHSRAESDLDWPSIYKAMSEIENDLKNYFPYKVIRVEEAEADDVAAVLCEWAKDNDTMSEGIFDNVSKPVLILFEDTDLFQLQKNKNVKQYSHTMKKFRSPDCRPEHYLLQHIAEGDSGDNFPSVLTGDQWSLDRSNGIKPKRQASLIASRKESFILNGRDECKTDEEKKNWDRNNELANFEMIPLNIRSKIIDEYLAYKPKGNKATIFNYFAKNKLKKLISEIDSF